MRLARASVTSGSVQAPAGGAGTRTGRDASAARAGLRLDWVLLSLLAAATVVRFATIGEQSLWYDEAYTPVHVLHASLGATLHTMVHTENSPPLWYVLIWGWSRVLGTGAVALRSLSAIAGVATVGVAWAIGRELGSRRTAIVLSAIIAFNPLFVWYSQEARVYALFAFLAAVSLWAFLRAWRDPAPRALAAWAVASVLALSAHYFAVFLVGPEAALLLATLVPGLRPALARLRPGGDPPPAPASPRAVVLAVAVLALAACALVPLIVAQGGHGTQWIGRWALSSRLVAIPGYFLLGGQSAGFGHALLLACAVPVLVTIGLLPGLTPREWRSAGLVFGLGAVSILVPLVLVFAGADYLAPRNVIDSWIPLAAALAVVLAGERAGVAGIVLTGLICAAGLGIIVATDLVPRFQRADWSGVAHYLGPGAGTGSRAIVTVELGAAPLEYYVPGLGNRRPGTSLRVSEVDLVGYSPVRSSALRPITPAFHAAGSASIHRLLVYRFVAASPQLLTEAQLRADRLTPTSSQVLSPAAAVAGALP